MNTDFYLGAAWTLIACGLGFIAALAWRGTRPEPPPRSDYDEFTAPDYPPDNVSPPRIWDCDVVTGECVERLEPPLTNRP